MKMLSISDVRNNLPSLIDEISQSREPVIVARYGRPIACITPFKAGKHHATQHPLRGKTIDVANDFDAPLPDMWNALFVAEEQGEYKTRKPLRRNRSRKPRKRRSSGGTNQ